MNRTRPVFAGLLSAVVLAAAGAAAHAADAPKGERYALLVGVRQYSEAKELRPLPYAENDVTELAQVLRDGGYKPDNVVLMTQTAGTDQLRALPMKARILRELDLLLRNRSGDDTVLVAFAGHGVAFKDDPVSYFCSADARLDDTDTLLSLTDVYRALEACPARTKVLLVDACRNDPLKDASRAPARLDLDSVTRPPEAAKDGGVAAFFSCSRGQKAYEDDKTKHGAFFRFVIEGLQGEASRGKDEVSLLELGAYVQRRVIDFTRAEYGAEQKPELNGQTRGAAGLVDSAGAAAWVNRGDKLYAARDYDKAIAAYATAIRRDDGCARAFRGRADAWYAKQEYRKAIADCDEAVRLDPTHAEAFYRRGQALAHDKDPDKAISDFGEAVRLNPKFALAHYGRAVTVFTKDPHNADAAIADLDEVIRLDPPYTRAYISRAVAYAYKKDWDRAIADYGEAIRLDPANPEAFGRRAGAWAEKGDLDKAVADLDEVVRLKPGDAGAFVRRGDTWRAKGDFDKAVADYTEGIRLDPPNAYAVCRRAEVHFEKQGKIDLAVADYTELIRIDPKNADAFCRRGIVLKAKGDLDNAIADFGEAVRLNPQYVLPFQCRGDAWRAKGDPAKANADYETARRLKDMK